MDSSGNSRPLLASSSDSDEDFIDDKHIEREKFQKQSVLDNDNEMSMTRSQEAMIEDNDRMTRELLKQQNAPHDRYMFNYIIFYLLGMTTLLPWNFFITAEDYWMYKFRNVNNTTDTDFTPIQAEFTSDLSFASAIPNTLFLILNAFIGHRIPMKLRMIGSLVVVFLFFIVTTALVKVNTDSWQNNFFKFTLFTVVIMNIAAAILGGGIFGISGLFPSEYITAVVSGQALGGIFAALAEIISLTFGASPTTSGFVYFMIGNVVLLISLIAYIVMSRTKFFQYYSKDKLEQVKSSQQHLVESSSEQLAAVTNEPNFYTVLRKIWIYGFTEWLVFVVTLCIYPSVTVLITSQDHGNGHPWNDIYFLPVVNYLIFNSGDYLGRILAGMLEWPRNRPFLIAFLSILRMVFVPALILCNTKPRHMFVTLFHSDYIFIVLMSLFAFSNGYLANIALIWAPKSVHNKEKEMASSMMAAFLGIGLAFGSSISLILVQIL